MIIIIALLTFIFTSIGGLLALRFRDKLHLVLGFSAGAVLGVAFFDLLPESIELGSEFYEPSFIFAVIALGFLIYLILDRMIFFHGHVAEHAHEQRPNAVRGMLGAGSLTFHSFLDGVAIGLAFAISPEIGIVVAVAVLVHDFSDGLNTVNMILRHQGNRITAMKWLAADAIAPVVGAASTLFFTLPERSLAIVLALFSGFFLYIGASDLIPESHHGHPKLLTTVMTLLGVGVLYAVVNVAHF